MVVATQNPIEHEGTFPLPEAQLDRFMLKVEVTLPDAAVERLILDLVEGEATGETGDAPPPIYPAEIVAARKAAMATHLSPAVKDYIVRLVTAPREPDTHAAIAAKVEHPASPRGTLALASAAKARPSSPGRDHVVPADVADLAGDILSHRTILTWRATADGATPRLCDRRAGRAHPRGVTMQGRRPYPPPRSGGGGPCAAWWRGQPSARPREARARALCENALCPAPSTTLRAVPPPPPCGGGYQLRP